jgi:hypothetical protein
VTETLAPSASHVVGWLLVSTVTGALVAWRVWPDRWRPRGPRAALSTTVAAVVGAYLAVSIGWDAEVNTWLDEEVIDRATKAEIDGTDVWLIAAVVALAVLGVAHLWRRSR